MGVVLGVAADRYNRVRMLFVCTLVFAVAILLQGTVKEYWHLILLRMVMAAGEAGCNPLATGIMSDIFPESKRALVMAIFNWGIYGGYGIAFPVGRYITKLDIGGLVSGSVPLYLLDLCLIEPISLSLSLRAGVCATMVRVCWHSSWPS